MRRCGLDVGYPSPEHLCLWARLKETFRLVPGHHRREPTYINVCVCVCVCVCECVCVFVCVHIPRLKVGTRDRTYAIYIHIYVYIHTQIHAYTHIHTGDSQDWRARKACSPIPYIPTAHCCWPFHCTWCAHGYVPEHAALVRTLLASLVPSLCRLPRHLPPV